MTEWRMAAPETVGMRSEAVAAVTGWLDNMDGSNVHGIVVVRNGLMVFQHYRNGPDESWRGALGTVIHRPGVKHDIRSVTKVVIGLLVGNAVARRLIPDLDVPLFEFFLNTPSYAHRGRSESGFDIS